MSEALLFEETVPRHFIAYRPTGAKGHGPSHLSVRPLATVERRCGKWLWWMRDESAIGLCDTFEGAREAVTAEVGDGTGEEFTPPTAEQAREVAERYCHSRGVDPSVFDAEEYIAYQEAHGWTTFKGSRHMKDWKTSVRAWVKRVAKV